MTLSGLNIFVANTVADVTPLNENFENVRLAINSNETNIGDLGALTTTQKNNIVAAINSAITALNTSISAVAVPAGVIVAISYSTAPSGYLLCNGAAVSRTTYASLFAAIGGTYGVGDGSTTFNLPDFRGYFLRGYLGGTSNEIGSAQSCGAPNITGFIGGGAAAYNQGVWGALYYTGNAQQTIGGSNWFNKDLYFDASRSNSVYGAASEIRPINHAVNFCIKY